MAFIPKLIFRIQDMMKSSYLEQNLDALKCNDFTIISSNCWGGILYKDLGLPYQSPFVNMYMYGDDFVKMVSDLRHYLEFELRFINKSKHIPDKKIDYPLALLKDVEIHFIHFKTREAVIEKWQERMKRINYNKLIFVMSERDGATERTMERFDQLPFENKICLTVNEYPQIKSAVKISLAFLFEVAPPADQLAGLSYSKVDVVKYINRTCG